MMKRYALYGLLLTGLIAIAALLGCAGQTPGAQPQATPESKAAAGQTAVKQYDAPPPMSIDPDKRYTATFQLDKQYRLNVETVDTSRLRAIEVREQHRNYLEFVVELFPKEAPMAVNSFVFLARNGYYDGVTFHRVIEGVMAQGGDHTGTGTGGPGYMFDNELSPLRRHDGPGVLSMANSGISNGKGTNGSQFFINLVANPDLDGYDADGNLKDCTTESCHTVFGRVIKGISIVKSIAIRDPNTATTPGDAIKTITIYAGVAGPGPPPDYVTADR